MTEMTNELAKAAARFWRATEQAYARKGPFLGAFALVLAATFAVLYSAGLTPDPVVADASAGVVLAASSSPAAVSPTAPELPVKVSIPSINLAVTVADPTTTDTSVLDQDLLSGAVRYPTSAELNEQGNLVIFGHSSYLPVVGNQAYKTFDGIQKLKPGDTITVYSSDEVYTYSVDTENEEDANSAGIPLDVSGQELTLSTCDSFATTSDRFVVTAHLVESTPSTNE
jgi:LPXTG-site transpeptidase (sortase) family protein